MAKLTSAYLNSSALRTLERFGDILMPPVAGMPAFSELGCLEQIDDVVAHAPQDDISTLNVVMSLLSIMPTLVLRFLVRSMQHPDVWPGPIARRLRKLDAGLRGLLFSLYYSGKQGATYQGKTPADVMEFRLRRVPRKPMT